MTSLVLLFDDIIKVFLCYYYSNSSLHRGLKIALILKCFGYFAKILLFLDLFLNCSKSVQFPPELPG